MRTLHDDPRLNALPRAWADASERVEQGPGIDCLTGDEIVLFLETGRGASVPPEERAIRSRAAEHLAECSFCTREVAGLYRARAAREARVRARGALGERVSRLAACVRVAVERTRGAFTHADGLLAGLGQPARLLPVFPQMSFSAVRGEDEGGVPEEDQLHEVTVSGDALAPAEILLSGEEEGGEITLTLREPLEVRLIRPDGQSELLPLDEVDGEYQATIGDLTAGEYCLALLRPET
jgi:hypothetical protein